MTYEARMLLRTGFKAKNISGGMLALPNRDPLMLAMVVLWVIWSLILAFIFANIFGRNAEKTSALV